MRGYTKKPCHGCGKVPEGPYGRPTEGVCRDCEQLLRFAREAKAALAKRSDLAPYSLPWRDYSLPHIYRADDAGDEFRNLVYTLIREIAEPQSLTTRFPNAPDVVEGVREREGVGLLRPAVRECINGIFHTAVKMTEEAREAGKKSGHSMMLRLARGEVSIEDYNQQAIEGGKK